MIATLTWATRLGGYEAEGKRGTYTIKRGVRSVRLFLNGEQINSAHSVETAKEMADHVDQNEDAL